MAEHDISPIEYDGSGQLVETEENQFGQFDVLANIQPRSHEDAQRIVIRYNTHADLLAACERVITFVYSAYTVDYGRAVMDQVLAAVAKAKGGA